MPNRLSRVQGPYLLQHSHTPVDWHPWGPEALALSRREEKPILLSIGYSTCHWCHVMERESFENPELAEILNRAFVPIKVDREERPDLDNLYMTAVQAMTGSGGWPMTVFLTPEKKPFFAGTYFPPDDRYGRPGFRRILLALEDAWKSHRGEVLEDAEKITEFLRRLAREAGPRAGGAAAVGISALDAAYGQLAASFDSRNGGFGGAPKFPTPH